MPGVLAAIDCGTNSTRLLVSERGTRTIERRMEITRLGRGVDATGALAPTGSVPGMTDTEATGQPSDDDRVYVTSSRAARNLSLS